MIYRIRAYIAFDIAENRLVFLKDYWRYDEPICRSELGVYMRLQEYGIQNTATAIAGGDVGGDRPQFTLYDEFLDTDSKLLHHRIVLKEVCRPLETYSNSPELIIATYHALLGRCYFNICYSLCLMVDSCLAHRDCWKLAGVMHCDISHNNIMLNVESDGPKGILLDWDNCKFREDTEEPGYAEEDQGGLIVSTCHITH